MRFVVMATAVLSEVIAKLGDFRSLTMPISVLLTLPEPRPGFDVKAANIVLNTLRTVSLPGSTGFSVEPVGIGHAGGFRALEVATVRLAQGSNEVCIVVGVDSYLEADTLDWIEANGSLARDQVRGGFVPGEGAGALALASPDGIARLGLPILARLRGVSTANEAQSIDSPEGLFGNALEDVVRGSTENLCVPEELIDDVYCDINGERHRVDDWGFMLMRVQTIFRDGTAYVTPVGSWGDLGAASGVLNCVLAVEALRRGNGQGPVALVCGSSNSGLRGAALLDRNGN
jgi:3-oxoacyl-[acyl-carrier-protein] synthase-1